MRVLIADTLSDAGVDALAEHLDVDVRTGLDKAELLEVLPAYDAVVIRSATSIDAEVLAAAERLKVIARAGIGLDNVDVDAATAKGIIVCNAPQSNVISAAEHTVALLLALARRVPAADASLRAGQWRRGAFEGVELHGKTLGVLGLGRVGLLVAQRCSAFGMRLVAYDPFVSAERAARVGVELAVSVDAICAQADVVSVHLPKTAETVGIVGEAQLRAMKPTALLVNTSRGGIVDEAALHRALVEGWIGGAALDVFATEPVTESPLFALDNVVVTPHLGASTAEAQDKAGTMVAEAVRLALAGEFVPSAVNVQVATAVPETVKPFMPLVEQLGRVLTALHSGQAGELVVEYHGRIATEDTQALTLAALKGVLRGVVSEPVTFVNAPLLAEERGLKVSTVASEASEDFVSLVRLRLGEAHVAGTLVGPKDRPRLVEVWGFAVDMELAEHMLFYRYTDRPGVIGLMGSRLGAANVNIATMQVGRAEQGGDALIAMTIDSGAPPEVVEDIRELIGSPEARAIDLG
jgi:D-3-phosphoglycerate dehydrogenase / 2-oxoglutarate reductase